MRGFVSLGGSTGQEQRMYALAASYNLRCSAKCRVGGVGKCSPALSSCCAKCLACCSCAVRQKLPLLMRRVQVDPTTGVASLGPVFWVADEVPAYTPIAGRSIPTLGGMSAQIQADVAQYNAIVASHVPVPTPAKPMVSLVAALELRSDTNAGRAVRPLP